LENLNKDKKWREFYSEEVAVKLPALSVLLSVLSEENI